MLKMKMDDRVLEIGNSEFAAHETHERHEWQNRFRSSAFDVRRSVFDVHAVDFPLLCSTARGERVSQRGDPEAGSRFPLTLPSPARGEDETAACEAWFPRPSMGED